VNEWLEIQMKIKLQKLPKKQNCFQFLFILILSIEASFYIFDRLLTDMNRCMCTELTDKMFYICCFTIVFYNSEKLKPVLFL